LLLNVELTLGLILSYPEPSVVNKFFVKKYSEYSSKSESSSDPYKRSYGMCSFRPEMILDPPQPRLFTAMLLVTNPLFSNHLKFKSNLDIFEFIINFESSCTINGAIS